MKHKILKLIRKLLGKKEVLGEFTARIKTRRKVFWEAPDSEYVINNNMRECDHWKNGKI